MIRPIDRLDDQLPDRFRQIVHEGGAPVLIGDHPQAWLLPRESQDGRDEVAPVRVVEHGRPHDVMPRAECTDDLLGRQLARPVHAQGMWSRELVIRLVLLSVEDIIGGNRDQRCLGSRAGRCDVLRAQCVDAPGPFRVLLTAIDIGPGCTMNDERRLDPSEHRPHGEGIGHVALGRPQRDHLGVCWSSAHQRPTQLATSTGDEDAHHRPP